LPGRLGFHVVRDVVCDVVCRLGLLAVSVGMVGCGDVNGSDPFAGTVMFQSADKSYHMRLLEPPWIPVTVQGQTIFVVPDAGISLSATSVSESDALYSLHVTPRPVNAVTAFKDSASAQTPPWDLSTKQTLTAVGGQSGVDISWQESDTVYHREAHIDGAMANTSFELLFTGPQPLADDGMILQMIISFGPGAGD
jgi:hypothetical protein